MALFFILLCVLIWFLFSVLTLYASKFIDGDDAPDKESYNLVMCLGPIGSVMLLSYVICNHTEKLNFKLPDLTLYNFIVFKLLKFKKED